MGDLAAVIPAYNAAETVGQVVGGCRRFLSSVVVVDDGSVDDTRGRAEAAGARVLSHPRNRGKGAALRTAFGILLAERFDALITLDADGQHDPADIPRFTEAFRASGAGLIIGSRSEAFAGMSAGRRFGNRFSSAALRTFSGLRLPDSQSGYRLYAAPFLRSVSPTGESYELEMEMILLAAARKVRVETIPVRVPVADGRALSHFRSIRDTYRICACVVGFGWRRMTGRFG